MLQYPVQIPKFSLSSSSTDSSINKRPSHFKDFHNNDSSNFPSPNSPILNLKRFQKESNVNRSSQFPLSISTNLPINKPSASEPPLPSSPPSPPASDAFKVPRSPYISVPNPSNPVQAPPSYYASPLKSSIRSTLSSKSSSAIDDILSPGDVVGEGLALQGETIRLVSIPPSSSTIAKEFEVVRRLGTGSYAVVYLVVEVLSRPPPSEDGHMSTIGSMELDSKSARSQVVYGREFAIKSLSKANLDEEALAAQMSEVTIHQSLDAHPNIATLHCTLETSSFLLILLEYVPGEDLFYFLEQARDHHDSNSPRPDPSVSSSRTPPTPSLLSNMHSSQLLARTRLRLISSMFSQMCEAVAACHAQQVFHRDIKPENFIVTDGWTTASDGCQHRKVIVKLTDFGLSATELDSTDMDCGSAPYMSYECRNNVAPTYRPRAADVWSLGIVLINMLYHYNPWTDTAQGVCSSFDAFRKDPVKFFMTRFTGMTLPVAEFFAHRVFCILEDATDDSQRVSASDFGVWVKDLPALFNASGTAKRTMSSSSQGHPISASTPMSHRPSSRNPSGISTAMRTPIVPSRTVSHTPSLKPTYERGERSDLSTVFDQEIEEGVEQREYNGDEIEVDSRSTSKRKRKRGARKGRGGSVASPTSPTDHTLDTLAQASESLAREISKASKGSSRSGHGLNSPTSPRDSMPMPMAKKPSKWKLGFIRHNGASPVDETAFPPEMATNNGMSATASGVTSLIMGLNASSAHSPPPRFGEDSLTWGRGRRGKNPSYNRTAQGYPYSTSPPATPDRWDYSDRRALSPNSTRSGRPATSSAGSVKSSNWRSSMSTTSSACTSTTTFSNSSTRSISTTATSVSSAQSWRTGNRSPPSSLSTTTHPGLPKNIKPMNGVPRELYQLPRGQHLNPVGDIYGSPPSRKQRPPRKPKDQKLDTISERERPVNVAQKSTTSPTYRQDVSTSTTDLTGHGKDDGETTEGVKKLPRGQINALAKMLSALRR